MSPTSSTTRSQTRHDRRLRRKVPRLAAGALLAGLLVGLTHCAEQPPPQCITSPSPFAVRLIEVSREESAPGGCDDFSVDSFNAWPEVGVSPYYERDAKGQPDYDRGSIAIQTAELGDLVLVAEAFGEENQATDGERYSLGPFKERSPDAAGYCHAPVLSPTHVVLPEIPAVEDDPETEEDDSFYGQPALDVRLEWSNFRVYVTAESYGTEFDADLVDTRTTADGTTCAVTYRAVGLAPAVPCMAFDPDTEEPLFDEDGAYVLDPAACDPAPDPDHGRPTGSGIGPGTRYVCDPVTAYCLLDGTSIRALR